MIKQPPATQGSEQKLLFGLPRYIPVCLMIFAGLFVLRETFIVLARVNLATSATNINDSPDPNTSAYQFFSVWTDIAEFLSYAVWLPIVAGGCIFGLNRINGQSVVPTEQLLPQDIKILSRFAVDAFGNMAFDDWEQSSPGSKLYVQVQFANQRERELMTPWEIFTPCGEGMTGVGVIEGNFLVGFSPTRVQMQSEPLPKDPFHIEP